MRRIISRRLFLAVTGGALVAPTISLAASEVPELLDHILLGCNNLQRGIDFVEQHTGVRATFGGVHPGRGTQNALVSLGERRYLEIIAPDPKQNGPAWHPQITTMTEPRLIGWAAHVGDINQIASRLRQADSAYYGPESGSRKHPDGRVLSWKNLTLKDDHGGLLPFFIEWSADSKHPSEDAPRGCRLDSFAAVSPNSDGLLQALKTLGVEMPVVRGEKEHLLAKLSSSKGSFEITS